MQCVTGRHSQVWVRIRYGLLWLSTAGLESPPPSGGHLVIHRHPVIPLPQRVLCSPPAVGRTKRGSSIRLFHSCTVLLPNPPFNKQSCCNHQSSITSLSSVFCSAILVALRIRTVLVAFSIQRHFPLERPEFGYKKDGQGPEQKIQWSANADEIGEPITPGRLNHRVCLIPNRCGKTG